MSGSSSFVTSKLGVIVRNCNSSDTLFVVSIFDDSFTPRGSNRSDFVMLTISI